jgi:hypothetical protein
MMLAVVRIVQIWMEYRLFWMITLHKIGVGLSYVRLVERIELDRKIRRVETY